MERPEWYGRDISETQTGKRRFLLLGLGNDILCDDAIGLCVVREIRKRLSGGEVGIAMNRLGRVGMPESGRGLPHSKTLARRCTSRDIDVRETCEMGLSLLDYIVGYDELILVDSIQTGRLPPGQIHELEGKDIKVLPVTTPHFLGVGEMIALGRQLGLPVPERVRIFAIEVQDPFTITTEMTPTLRAAMPRIVERVWTILSG